MTCPFDDSFCSPVKCLAYSRCESVQKEPQFKRAKRSGDGRQPLQGATTFLIYSKYVWRWNVCPAENVAQDDLPQNYSYRRGRNLGSPRGGWHARRRWVSD